MTAQTRVPSVPLNGACPSSSLSGRHRVTAELPPDPEAAAAAAAAAAASGSGGGGGAPASSPGSGQTVAEGLATAVGGTGAGTTTEQRLSRMLDKIYETIELNELRLLIQDHKDAVKLEWQQVDDVALLVHGQVTIIFVVSVCLFVCLFVQSFSQPSLIQFRSNLDIMLYVWV